MKLALLKPEPSWALAMTASFSAPPRPKLYCWKLPESSSKPYLQYPVNRVKKIKFLGRTD